MPDHPPADPGAVVAEPVSVLADRIEALVHARPGIVVVGIDGRSGAGKSTLARAVAAALAERGRTVTVVEGDDFYAGGSATTWDTRDVEAKVAGGIDWRRQHDLLRALRDTGTATYRPFDWDAPDWDADVVPLGVEVPVVAGDAVILEGAYSCRPELADLLDLRVLLDVPADVRRRQLLEREGADYRADWEGRWSAAEVHYFGTIVPPDSFDLVLGLGLGLS